MTEIEAKYMKHLNDWGDSMEDDEKRRCARVFSKLNPFELNRLPELLEAEMQKKEKTK